jgi:hypothetical protein
MKRLPKNAKTWLVCTTLALLIHTISSYIVFRGDLILAIQERAQGPLVAMTFLVAARMFLYFVAPSWAVYLVMRTFVERKFSKPKQ